MRKYFVTVTILALLVMLAPACAPAGAPAPTPTPAPAPSAPVPTPAPPPPTPTPPPEPTPTVEWGIIEVRVTDPGPADVKSADVYLTNIKAHKVSDNVSEWITISDNISSFNLMDVIGVEKVLTAVKAKAGSFTQIRMDVTKVEVVTTAGDNITAEVPSGELKIVRPFNVEGGVKTVLTLDFDGEKSVIVTGKKALFKPVVKLWIGKEKSSPPGEKKAPEARLEVKLEGEAAPGQTVTLLVTSEGKPVEGATVKVNGKNIGQTDKNGTISFTIPEDAKQLEIEAKLGKLEGELKIKFEGEKGGKGKGTS